MASVTLGWWYGAGLSDQEVAEIVKAASGDYDWTNLDDEVATIPATIRKADLGRMLDGLRRIVSGETINDTDYVHAWLMGLGEAIVMEYQGDPEWEPDEDALENVLFFHDDDEEGDEDDPDELGE